MQPAKTPKTSEMPEPPEPPAPRKARISRGSPHPHSHAPLRAHRPTTMMPREMGAPSATPRRATLAPMALVPLTLALPAVMLLANLVALALVGERTAETLFLAGWASAVFL